MYLWEMMYIWDILLLWCIYHHLLDFLYHCWFMHRLFPMDFVLLFWCYMDSLYDWCRICRLYMICYACFIYHDINLDLWSMMDTDTFSCTLFYDMVYICIALTSDCSRCNAFICCFIFHMQISWMKMCNVLWNLL